MYEGRRTQDDTPRTISFTPNIDHNYRKKGNVKGLMKMSTTYFLVGKYYEPRTTP